MRWMNYEKVDVEVDTKTESASWNAKAFAFSLVASRINESGLTTD